MPTFFADHLAGRILHIDYRGLGNELRVLEEEIEKTRRVVAQAPPQSLLTLTDVRGARITPDTVRLVRHLAEHNRPFVLRGAVVGESGIYLTAFRSVMAVSRRRNLESFTDPGAARDWLVKPEPDLAPRPRRQFEVL
jgi:hypothetical protein